MPLPHIAFGCCAVNDLARDGGGTICIAEEVEEEVDTDADEERLECKDVEAELARADRLEEVLRSERELALADRTDAELESERPLEATELPREDDARERELVELASEREL
jgi:hypothetical protein